MEFMRIRIDDLIPAAYNPRKKLKSGDSEYEKIKRSIQEFGYVDPVIVNRDMTVIGGHQRITVLRELGYTEIDCVVIDIDKTREKALNLALNKISGVWDKEMLADLIKDLQALDFDMASTGFEPPEIDQLFSEIFDKEVSEDDFDVDEELKEQAISRLGDIWHLGTHRLICGDSTQEAVYTALMAGKKADLVVTDPPYGVAYEGGQGTIQNDNLADREFYDFLFSAFSNMEKVMQQNASIYVFHADTKGLVVRKAFEDAGFHLSGVCQWVKQTLVLGRSPYQWRHEPCLFGWKRDGKHRWYAGRKETTVWEYGKPAKSPLHSTMKPVQLIAYAIRNSSAPGALVLDPFVGSGTAIIACEQLCRVCFSVELDEKYVDVCVKRYIEHMGSSDDVFLERDGERIPWDEVKKLLMFPDS